jgi:microcystin-dependent protein
MSCTTTCDQCDPCETSIAVECTALEESLSPVKLVVEDIASCKKSIQSPENISLLQHEGAGDIYWADGSEDNIFGIPNLQDHDINSAPKIIVTDSSGTLKQWQPSSVGNNFVAYWDGSDFVIGTLSSLFPAGNGVLVKSGNNITYANGINGQILTIAGSIQFNTIALGAPPVGTILAFGGTIAPSGYLFCDGSAVNRITYASLFSLLGTTYGAGDGLTTFNIPDYRGVFIRGNDQFRTLGSLQAEELLQHSHLVGSESSHTHGVSTTTQNQSNDHTHFVSSTKEYISPDGQFSVLNNATSYIAKSYTGGSLGEAYTLQGFTTNPTVGITSTSSQGHTHSISATSSAGTSHNHPIGSSGGTETAPINIALNFIIKT